MRITKNIVTENIAFKQSFKVFLTSSTFILKLRQFFQYKSCRLIITDGNNEKERKLATVSKDNQEDDLESNMSRKKFPESRRIATYSYL